MILEADFESWNKNKILKKVVWYFPNSANLALVFNLENPISNICLHLKVRMKPEIMNFSNFEKTFFQALAKSELEKK